MPNIKSLYIPIVEKIYDYKYIMNAFYANDIATIMRVTMLPFYKKGIVTHFKTYVDIAYWHDNEAAYNFIQRIKNSSVETHFIHNDDSWWIIKNNIKPDITSKFKYKNNTFQNLLIDNEKVIDELETDAVYATSKPNIKENEDIEWIEIEKDIQKMREFLKYPYP